jgi:hypothetical protein
VGIKEVRWDKGELYEQGITFCSMEKEMKTGFFV